MLVKPVRLYRLESERGNQAARKRSLWRAILCIGKAPKPKRVCETRRRSREYDTRRRNRELESARQPSPVPIPPEYEGRQTVRVAGKQVAYTRAMQRTKRSSLRPLDSISEDDD
jgi:hypothetical protein